MTDKVLDTVIIGAGPAGLSAGIYASRAGLDFKIIEKLPISGGQTVNTGQVENYPGFSSVGGFELSQKFYEHSLSTGAKIENAEIKNIAKANDIFSIEMNNGERLLSKTVIAATGAVSKKSGVKGEADFSGKGVSYCAHCDGAFYRNKTVAVVGGGDTAVTDAIYLANLCKKVYIIHRRKSFRAAGSLLKKLESFENVEFITDSVLKEIKGDIKVASIVTEDVLKKIPQTIDVDGVFIAIGISPRNQLFKDIAETDSAGFLCAGEDCKTSLPGLFAVGDLRTKPLRQIVTAASDGANAIHSVEGYLRVIK